ncbi:erythromycin esterase family protein [Haladaptatus salinisoli]|uniref:erythromycin esterase family protein n=1 Tax=Haladaptatus salinisoli TaxID=2884876 RepID=UPI001D09ABDD|nr:erythromycin esterase family protein [Haladaptatus salinisoli]
MTNDASSTDDSTDTRRKTNPIDRTVVDALDDHAIPLDAVDPTADFDDLAPLSDVLADDRIVGLGEATHGTREFFRLKHRLLRYLVTEHDVRVFGLEANFSETLALDDYVVYGEGDPRSALDGIYFWTWNVDSILEMVDWLRSFNADRPVDDRVRFYGFDAQYSHGAVDELVEFFESADAEYLSTVRDDLNAADDEGTPPHQDEARKAHFEAAERVIPKLRDRLHENREFYVERRSESAWELALQHVRIVEQACEHKRAVHDRQEGTVDEDTATERCLRIRDRAMADNVDWILAHENADRMVIWAHDAHLNRVEQTVRKTGVSATSLGGHLAARHGDDYYALGFSFGRGSFQAISEVPDAEGDEPAYSLRERTVESPLPDTIDATLADLGHPLAIVDIESAMEDDRAAEWLADPQRHFSVGATYDPENPEEYLTEYVYAEAFDGVCYVDETTRARPVESVESR